MDGNAASGHRRVERAKEARARREKLTAGLFESQYGVASRRQLYRVGLGRWDLKVELGAGRWMRCGPQTVSNRTGELDLRGRWWAAVLEVGARAALDGITALQAAGLEGFDEPAIHISMPKSGRPRRRADVHVHETRRRGPDDLVGAGVPRTRPPVAAIRAALWARSTRQAALVLTMAVQQRLATVDALLTAMESVQRHRRRAFVLTVLGDLRGGVQSLNELDFARMCRAAGLPEPDRQVVHDLGHGRAYVDTEWTQYGLIVEIDGVQHTSAPAVIADALRGNDLARQEALVLHIPVLGLRTDPDRFLTQVRNALLSRGWQPGLLPTSEELERRPSSCSDVAEDLS